MTLSTEASFDRAVEQAVEHAVFGHDPVRRSVLKAAGAGAVLGSLFPIKAAQALLQEGGGALEKKDPKIGFIPITRVRLRHLPAVGRCNDCFFTLKRRVTV